MSSASLKQYLSGKRLPWKQANRDGSPWYARTFRITSIRVFSQVFFFSLFMFLLWVTWFSRLATN